MSRLQSGLLIASRYRLLSKIGSGGFSEIWLCEDSRSNGIQVALKIFAPDNGLDSEGLAVFSREYSLVFNLNHPHLLKPMHYDEWDGMPYLVMQYMAEGSVSKLCGRMSEGELARFLVQIGDALRYLHAQDPPIVHQDIKPGNVLMDGKGNYYLSDFGISTKIRRTLSRSVGRLVEDSGTMAYMAPERFSKRLEDRLPIKASDVFSLGVTMFELLTDELPYGEMGGVVAASGVEPAELPERYSRELRALVSACLSREPWDRPMAEVIVKAARMYVETGRWGYGGAELEEERDPLAEAKEEGEIARFVEAHGGTPSQSQVEEFYWELSRRYGRIGREEFERVLKEEMEKTRPYGKSSGRLSKSQEGRRKVPVWRYVWLAVMVVLGVVIGILIARFQSGREGEEIARREKKFQDSLSALNNLNKICQDSLKAALRKAAIAESIASSVKQSTQKIVVTFPPSTSSGTITQPSTTPSVPSAMEQTSAETKEITQPSTTPSVPSRVDSPSSYTESYGGLNMEMVWIEGGEYWMGCTPEGDRDCESDEFPRHRVTLSGFWMGRTEVTNAQFCVFLNERGNQVEGGVEWINLSGSLDDERCRIKRNGGRFEVERGYEQYPVIYVSWYGARAFAAWLSERTGREYRLPSEAQWEYACRSRGKEYKYAWGNGSPTRSNGGNIADETARGRYGNWTIWRGYTDGYVYTAPVGSFGVNEAGLSDMSGNVWEWCEDRWHSNYHGAPTDGSAWVEGGSSSRCVRGGSWYRNPRNVRCSNRSNGSPDGRDYNLSFRLVRIR